MPIILLTFPHKNDSLSAEGGHDSAPTATDTRRTNSSTAPVPGPRKANLDLQFHTSALPALAFNLKSVDFFTPVRSLHRLFQL